MRFFLSYVNMPINTTYYEREFETMIQLMAYVNEHHVDWISYQIIVTKAKGA